MLNSLTGLRFFAALAIVFFHVQGNFGVPLIPGDFKLQQGVSFFFVLSGFILCYRYPSIVGVGQYKDFIVARIARIWPAHIVTLIASTVLLLGDGQDYPQFHGFISLASNALLLHAWVPLTEFFLPYNSVSWSISAELAFYILFPAFLLTIRVRPLFNLLVSLLLAIAMIVTSESFDVPGFNANNAGVSTLGLLYINPIARLFEFVLGMTACVLWRNSAKQLPKSLWFGFVVEILAILFVVFNSQIGILLFESTGVHLNRHFGQWFASSGTVAIPAALLIVVFAQGVGPVSRLLSRRIFVFLGEISFAIYMVHQLVFRVFVKELPYIYDWPEFAQLILYFAVTFVSAHVLWEFVEKPGRDFIKSAFSRGWVVKNPDPHVSKVRPGPAKRYAARVEISVLFVIFLIPIFFSGNGIVSDSRASVMAEKSLIDAAEFGGKIKVVSAFYLHGKSGYELSLLWQALEDVSPDLLLAIHVSEGKEVLSQASSVTRRTQQVKAGQIFLDRIPIRAEQLKPPASHVSVVFFVLNNGPLVVSGAQSDWDGHRLVLPLPSR